MSGWLGGVQVRRTERGQVPVVDFLCTRCGTHRRATGRDLARDYLASDPITQHRAICPAASKDS
jgi:hypothetical protein